MRTEAKILLEAFLITLASVASIAAIHPTRVCAEENVWYVHDVIDVTLDNVKWLEEGGTHEPPAWISEGSWYQASMSQSLVSSEDVFVQLYEYFNWTMVKLYAEYFFDMTFNTFYDFGSFVMNNPHQWLDLSWQIDTAWYGVPLNTTKIKHSYDENTASAEMWTWFHITRIPEYFVGEGNLENWLTGFDLTPVSTGRLETWEFHKYWTESGVSYTLLFKAPANLLSRHGDNYTLTLNVSPSYRGRQPTVPLQQVIDINMPTDTEIIEAIPTNLSLLRGNTATFVITTNETYPVAFTVVSGPPAKPLNQIIWESASEWLLTPRGWAAIASLTVLSFTGLRGRRIWNRSRLYHRFYKSMVTVYDMYSKDLVKFNQEMDNISRSIIKMLVEDKITDDQFEKLLRRRDDLLARTRE